MTAPLARTVSWYVCVRGFLVSVGGGSQGLQRVARAPGGRKGSKGSQELSGETLPCILDRLYTSALFCGRSSIERSAAQSPSAAWRSLPPAFDLPAQETLLCSLDVSCKIVVRAAERGLRLRRASSGSRTLCIWTHTRVSGTVRGADSRRL